MTQYSGMSDRQKKQKTLSWKLYSVEAAIKNITSDSSQRKYFNAQIMEELNGSVRFLKKLRRELRKELELMKIEYKLTRNERRRNGEIK